MPTAVLTLAAHTAGAGRPVSALGEDIRPAALIGVALGSALVVAVLAARRRPPGVIMAALAGLQLGQHYLMAAAPSDHAVSCHGGGGAGHVPGWRMLTAHLLAAGLTALLIGHGETVLREFWQLLRRVVRLPDALPSLHPTRPSRLTVALRARTLRPLPGCGVPSLRGPPGSVALT